MLKLRIKELAKSRGITHLYSHLVQKKISTKVAWKLTNDKATQLSLKNTQKLCDIFKCEPNDLFVYDTKDKAEIKEKVWFAKILPETNRPNIGDMLVGATEEQLRIIEAYLKQMFGGGK
jgi:DNA-binding Xre family transcriptional regulator